MATLQVELVAVEKMLWSGEASMVIARTTEGELGVMPGHSPLLGELAPGGVVTIRTESGEDLVVAAHGGFLSVTERGVSILAETAEISTDIDVERAREALRRAEQDRDDPEAVAAARRAQSRLRAAGQDA
ncbi:MULTISPECIES: F0F1 ATP synthase subunit epsilon [unclassified Modestobacter]|uniref:F0F1 ATP synthase subunit epsilon n=1 Tax=unclassified Modestobacter TaxID=2643866 RepID=UPI0022AB26E8|nr:MULTISPECIES: F0F1 ATP synthase subunit epsilon [unclassified Modestobacter]MCZ2812519.1 F0F1 ATP synthase subunit epsilon [Modestobacter sp. VKM Ac-2979]MCZ2841409.1 F0F1 ATP synthase subunit epsilon [Modestobacter sp. VKM Ac-2980]MCZ2850144.1 F0F1 ATP synthase subunit epsilon [Modestobacter sp. VKM Ac-2978]